MNEGSPNVGIVLDEGTRKVSSLGWEPIAKDFYLAGGTGLAVQLGHRRSFDLDFFQFHLKERIDTGSLTSILERLFPKQDRL